MHAIGAQRNAFVKMLVRARNEVDSVEYYCSTYYPAVKAALKYARRGQPKQALQDNSKLGTDDEDREDNKSDLHPPL